MPPRGTLSSTTGTTTGPSTTSRSSPPATARMPTAPPTGTWWMHTRTTGTMRTGRWRPTTQAGPPRTTWSSTSRRARSRLSWPRLCRDARFPPHSRHHRDERLADAFLAGGRPGRRGSHGVGQWRALHAAGCDAHELEHGRRHIDQAGWVRGDVSLLDARAGADQWKVLFLPAHGTVDR